MEAVTKEVNAPSSQPSYRPSALNEVVRMGKKVEKGNPGMVLEDNPGITLEKLAGEITKEIIHGAKGSQTMLAIKIHHHGSRTVGRLSLCKTSFRPDCPCPVHQLLPSGVRGDGVEARRRLIPKQDKHSAW